MGVLGYDTRRNIGAVKGAQGNGQSAHGRIGRAGMDGRLICGAGLSPAEEIPQKPDMVKIQDIKPGKDMDDENIKTVLTTFAEIHNTIEGAK